MAEFQVALGHIVFNGQSRSCVAFRALAADGSVSSTFENGITDRAAPEIMAIEDAFTAPVDPTVLPCSVEIEIDSSYEAIDPCYLVAKSLESLGHKAMIATQHSVRVEGFRSVFQQVDIEKGIL